MKEENELEVVSKYDKNKNDNEGKIFRSDKNKKIKLKKKNKHTHFGLLKYTLFFLEEYCFSGPG